MADIAASVLAKLKNKAKSSGISYQQCLWLFFQEEYWVIRIWKNVGTYIQIDD